jgi:glucose-1-phosphate adenylyltransferase
VIALILAGGQGERLSLLSVERAKPAVPFGGKYRIIDFALSNCVHSSIYDVIVLTQYRPISLHDHIGAGKAYDLDRSHGIGVRLISPYLGRKGADWYRGTADAVYQNIAELLEHRPEATLILGGDHIYTMDYRPMLAFHQARKADVTVGVMEVPIEEAHRFGIVTLDRSGRITDWHEKPRRPASNLVSMGIYVFRTDVLIDRLVQDAAVSGSRHDFGHDVVPRMLAEGDRVFGYRFGGYWRDVGTIQSYWEANMELLAELPGLDLWDRRWPIFTKNEARAPSLIDSNGSVEKSLVSAGCRIDGHIQRSVLSPGVIVEEGAIVRDSIVLFDCAIGRNAVVDRAIIDKETIVGANGWVGFGEDLAPNETEPQRLTSGITLVGKRAVLPDGVRIGRNCRISGGAQPSDFPSLDVPSGSSIG